jgi:hypothetical protein
MLWTELFETRLRNALRVAALEPGDPATAAAAAASAAQPCGGGRPADGPHRAVSDSAVGDPAAAAAAALLPATDSDGVADGSGAVFAAVSPRCCGSDGAELRSSHSAVHHRLAKQVP